jgi:pimeloyl-ACP methyl ester carboxylesterase
MPNTLYRNLTQKLFSLVALTGILSGAFSVSAQTRRTSTTKTSNKTAAAPTTSTTSQTNCKGGWSGIITFKKTLNETYAPGKQKNIARGTTEHRTSRDYKYTGRIVVDGSNPQQSQTKSQVLFNDTDKAFKRFEQMDTCFYDGKKESVLQWSETTESRIDNAFGEGEANNFSLNVNEFDGTYSFGFRFPDAKGTVDEVSKIERGGWCGARNNQPENFTKKEALVIPGDGAEIDGKIEPKNPDVLSGSKTWGGGTGEVKSFTYTVTWSFKRCPAPIEVTDIRFDERPYGKPETWREIKDGEDTVDGNRVRIRATIVNFSGETRFPTIKFNEEVENWELPEGEKSVRLEAGEEKEIELEWDTSGYAWRGKGWDAESNRKIKVEAVDEGRTSALTKPIMVSPRPVVLVHGLWSNAWAWNEYKNFFWEAHSNKWDSFAVGEEVLIGKMNTGDYFGNSEPTSTISENAAVVNKQIEHVRELRNAWHVDLVVHSMGGLISRYYIQNFMPTSIDEKPVVTKLLMLGTPNMGSPCADLMYSAFYAVGRRVEALRELKPSIVEQFNENVTRRRGVRFSALVGKAIPQTCQSREGGDGVVPVSSAIWEIRDWRYSNSLAHTDLTSRADFGAFVFPRLAVGPRGNHDIEMKDKEPSNPMKPIQRSSNEQAPVDRYGFGSVFRKASYQKQNADDEAAPEGLILAKEVKLQPNQTAEIEIPVPDAARAAVVFVAPPNVSAVLLDSANKIVGENKAGTPEAKQMFRTISLDKTASGGNLKLKFESREAKETIVYAAAFADTNPLSLNLTAGQPTASGQVSLAAKLTHDNAPVAGAFVKARILFEDGKTAELNLRDDGQSGDGAAGDGVYGALSDKLADGDYSATAKAETGGKTLVAATSFTVGAAQKELTPVKTVTKKTKK